MTIAPAIAASLTPRSSPRMRSEYPLQQLGEQFERQRTIRIEVAASDPPREQFVETGRRDTRQFELRRRLGIEDLLASVVESAEVAGCRHAARELRAGGKNNHRGTRKIAGGYCGI